MPRHRGGVLVTYDASGKPTGSLHYGEGLHKQCSECNVAAYELCITSSGKLLKKSHKARLTG